MRDGADWLILRDGLIFGGLCRTLIVRGLTEPGSDGVNHNCNGLFRFVAAHEHCPWEASEPYLYTSSVYPWVAKKVYAGRWCAGHASYYAGIRRYTQRPQENTSRAGLITALPQVGRFKSKQYGIVYDYSNPNHCPSQHN